MTECKAKSVEFDGHSFCVDASLVAASFGMTPALLQLLMRQARITSRSERGVDQDEGRHRLTFFHGARRLRLVVDAAGVVIDRRIDRIASGGRAPKRASD
jgi:hypothetical protein